MASIVDFMVSANIIGNSFVKVVTTLLTYSLKYFYFFTDKINQIEVLTFLGIIEDLFLNLIYLNQFCFHIS